jgi:glycosyltransferase involved in cell wall biosynthesis
MSDKMNLVLVSHCNFLGQSSYHVHSMAKELSKLGNSCVVCVPDKAELADRQISPAVPLVNFADALEQGFSFPDGRGPALIHCWTPREHVRQFTRDIVDRYRCPYVVHLEDNEFEILTRTLKSLFNAGIIKNLFMKQGCALKLSLIRPSQYWRFMRNAAGVTTLMDRLLEHVPEGTPGCVFWPGYDEIFSEIPVSEQLELRSKYGVPEDAFVVLYSGAFHVVNQDEIEKMLHAIVQLRSQGIPLRFLKTGPNELQDIFKRAVHENVMTDLGFISRFQLPELLAIADIIIQPGSSDAFNDYRFPSKLPEALISGKPVILPHSNLGRFIVNEVQAVITETGDSSELAEKISMLYHCPELRILIGTHGRAFALESFNWESSARKISDFYREFCLPGPAEISAPGGADVESGIRNKLSDLKKENEKLKYFVMDRNASITSMNRIITLLSQTVREREAEISVLSPTVAEKDAYIAELKNSRSWRITRPLRLIGRIARGDWKSVKDYFARSIGNRFLKAQAGYAGATESAAIPEDQPVSAFQLAPDAEQPREVRRKILLVSYYCPTRAHAGGLRILDIYSQIKAEFPDVGLDLFTYRRPAMDWSYQDIEDIFDSIYYSDTPELDLNGLLKQCRAYRHYDVIDLQFHRSAEHMNEFRKLGDRILFTPMESLASAFYISLREAVCHAHWPGFRDMLAGAKHAAEEVMFCRKADEVVCVSLPDASFMRRVSRSGNIVYLESGLSDIEFKDALSERSKELAPQKKENIIIYVAFFGSTTNILAMKWYLEKVHPLVKEHVPDYVLHVVGRGDLSVFADYQDGAVNFIGSAPSLGPYISQAKVGIAPALGGSGLRGKMSQYAIYGVPSVASPIAAKGLTYEDGIDIYITDVPEKFAERCVLLLKDDEANRRIGERARETAFAKYTWRSKMDIIRRIYALDDCVSTGNPKVTALVPSYNHARYLRKRIESVIRQTYDNVELIVIDDCSGDESDEVIRELQAQYGFTYVRNESNSGSPFTSWENGMNMGTGDYIWICESDDYADTRFLEAAVDALKRNSGAVLTYCDSWIVDEQDQRIDHTDTYFHDIWRESRWDRSFINFGADELRNFQLRGQTVPNMSSALFSMSAFRKAYSPFLKKFGLCGDWLFVGWVLRHGSVVYRKQTLSHFRKHEITARVRIKSARSQAEYIMTKYLLFRISGHGWRDFSVIMSLDAIRFLYEPAGFFDVLGALMRISISKTLQCGGLLAASLLRNGHLVRKFWQRYKLVKGGA